MPRRRTSTNPSAHVWRTGNAELATVAPRFLPARRRWTAETRERYRTLQRSDAARALRPEDVSTVRRLFDYSDELARRWDAWETGARCDRDALAVIKALEAMVSTLTRSLGIGPVIRVSLGLQGNISTPKRPKLAAFMANDAA